MEFPGHASGFGIGTTYGDAVYHLFESQGLRNIDKLYAKCSPLLGGDTDLSSA